MRAKEVCMAITALAIAGCSQNEIRDLNPEVYSPVGFSIYTGAQTKGAATTTASIQGADHFAILAYSTGTNAWAGTTEKPDFMYNQEVTYNAGKTAWEYSPLKYWSTDAGQKISFFAYAPYEGSPADGGRKGIILSDKTTAGTPSITFRLQNSADKMVDLVTDAQLDKTKDDNTVSFTLDHVLTRATFAAKLNKELTGGQTHVFVTGMKIVGTGRNTNSKFYNQAKYTFNPAAGAMAWSDHTAAADDYSLAAAMDLQPQTATIPGYTFSAVDLTSMTEKTLFKTGEYLYLIPWDAAGISADTDVKVEVTYDIVTKDDNLAGGYAINTNSFVASLPSGTLKECVSYKYVFEISLTTVSVDVKVSAIVTDWTTPDTPGNI